MKRVYGVLFAITVFAAAFAGFYAYLSVSDRVHTEGRALIGGPFSLVDTNGKHVTDRDFRGKLMLVFFGYTHCPDVCPTELQNMADVMEKLGPDAGKVAPIFISVDPARDKPSELGTYVKNFSALITGLTGDQSEVASVAKAYRVYFRKAGDGTNGDYAVDHSAFLYLMDGEGKYLTHFSFNTAPETITREIKKQITANSASNGA